jgi:hypothetical protein
MMRSMVRKMVYRIKIVIRGLGGVVYEGDYLKRNGQIYEFSTKEECQRAIESLENGDFLHLKGLLECVEV